MKINYIKLFRRLNPVARELFKDKNKINKLIDEYEKMAFNKKTFTDFAKELTLIFGLLKDFLSGTYKNVKKKDIIMITAAMVYLVNPMDLVPDLLLGIGFIDDLSVLAYVVKKLKNVLDDYEEWKNNNIFV